MKTWHIGVGALALVAAPLAARTEVPGLRPSDFAAALIDNARPPADLQRDEDRKPADLLAFAEVRPDTKVAEISPGGGYFTRLLSIAVGPKGKVYASSSRPLAWLDAWKSAHPNTSLHAAADGSLAPEPVDLVWTTQNYHDFKNRPADATGKDGAARTNAAAFAALRPGGIYLVGDHEAASGAGTTVTNTLHRIESAAVIREVEASGFKLDGRSEVLRHPADNHASQVFDSGVRGKTDQFVLKFRKPKTKR